MALQHSPKWLRWRTQQLIVAKTTCDLGFINWLMIFFQNPKKYFKFCNNIDKHYLHLLMFVDVYTYVNVDVFWCLCTCFPLYFWCFLMFMHMFVCVNCNAFPCSSITTEALESIWGIACKQWQKTIKCQW